MKPINPERRPDVTSVFRRLKRLYDSEKVLIENGAPIPNFLWDKFQSVVEESNLDLDEVEEAIDEWDTNSV
jgi:hypothetical protein